MATDDALARERQAANEFKTRLRAALEPVTMLMDEATRAGFVLQFQLANDQFGRSVIQNVGVIKPL